MKPLLNPHLNLNKIKLYCILRNIHNVDDVPFRCLNCANFCNVNRREQQQQWFTCDVEFKHFEIGYKEKSKKDEDILHFLGCGLWKLRN